MFDRYLISPRLNADVSVRREEKRAPTDESVRLLREMEQKARDEIIRSIPVESNGFKAVMQQCHSDMEDCELYRLVFKLNGETLIVDAKRFRHEAISEFVLRFHKLISDEIAAKLLRNITVNASA